jgi:hypothetical protein
VRCDLVDGTSLRGKIIDLSTEGISVKIDGPLPVREKVTVEFLLPNTLNSIQLSGEVVWYRVAQNGAGERKHPHFAGIKFDSLKEADRNFICSFSLKVLDDEDLVQQQGIDRVLSDVSNLPPMERQRALDILARKGLISREKRQQLGILKH